MGEGKALVDVCRRWRHIIFASPQRLDLRLICNSKTPARTSLDMWPPCPIVVYHWCSDVEDEGEENVIAALERSDRVTKVTLNNLKRPASKKFTSVMTVPFPALKELRLWSADHIGPFLPATFLGESAPHLQLISLNGIAFRRTIRKLLSSARHLSDLLLTDIPINCHIPPQDMVTCLSASTHLEYATIHFRPNRPHPSRKYRPPTSRAILPALAHFRFEGDFKYMEDLVSRIAAPQLRDVQINLFDDEVPEFPQLREFIALAVAGTLPPFGGHFVRKRPSGWLLYLYP